MRYIRKGAVMLFLLALTGCSKDEAGNDSDAPVPVRFEAGSPEVFKSRSLIESESALQGAGFGVFAYMKGISGVTQCYDGENNWVACAPNFMYNQQVTYSGGWTYTPVKYWPNDNNPADGSGASGSQTHSYVSFFAYAPYFDTSSSPASGVTAISANNATGAPALTYKWAADADLLYASQIDRYKYDSDDANDNGRVGDVVPFIFRHALAKVVFKVRRSSDFGMAVTLKSLSISGFSTSGTFNLGTETPSWSSRSGSGSQTLRSTDLSVTAITESAAHDLGGSLLIPGSSLTYSIQYTIGETNNSRSGVSLVPTLISSLQVGYQYSIIFTVDTNGVTVNIEKYTEQW